MSVNTLNNLKAGDHLCLLHEAEEEHTSVLSLFIRQGLENDEQVLCIGDSETSAAIKAFFKKIHFDLKPFLKKRQLVFTSWDILIKETSLTPDTFISSIRSELNGNRYDKATRLRIATEVTPLLKRVDPESLIDFESKLDAFLQETGSMGFCQYNVADMDISYMLDLLLTHPLVITGQDLYQNYYYASRIHYDKGHLSQAASRYILQIFRDRVQRETALRRSEGMYRDLFENALEGIFQRSPDGTLISANPAMAHMLGYASPQALINADLEGKIYVSPEQRKKLLESMRRNGSVHGIETKAFRADGEEIWLSVNARSVRDNDNRVIYYEGTIEDITARKQSEEQLKKTLNNVRTAMEGTIHAVAMTVEAKDPYTAGHQHHVGMLARAIARSMRLSPDQTEGIYLTGTIHDLGKISIPTEFLSKPGKLTDYEYTLIKTHPESGYKILQDIAFPWPVAEIILQHHERIDGSGYPKGLKGKEILTEAKVIAVADVVEAITFNRPYRPAYGLRLAMQEIERNQGALYDPAVAKACLELLQGDHFNWDSVAKSQNPSD